MGHVIMSGFGGDPVVIDYAITLLRCIYTRRPPRASEDGKQTQGSRSVDTTSTYRILLTTIPPHTYLSRPDQ